MSAFELGLAIQEISRTFSECEGEDRGPDRKGGGFGDGSRIVFWRYFWGIRAFVARFFICFFVVGTG